MIGLDFRRILIVALLTTLFLSSTSAYFNCIIPTEINASRTRIGCEYESTEPSVIVANLNTDDGLFAKIISPARNAEANMKYTLDINVNYKLSKSGTHKMIVNINNKSYTYDVYINKKEIDVNYSIDYTKDYALLKVIINNSSDEDKFGIIDINIDGLNSTENNIIIKSSKNSVTNKEIKLYYTSPKATTGNVSVIFSNNKFNLNVPIYTQNIPANYNSNSVGLFSLGSGAAIYGLIIILFVIASVLFAMFISRLSKVIVKN